MISLFLAMCITLPHSLAEDTTPEPFTIAVVIDPKAKAFAANALKEFKKTPPFNELGEQLQILEIEGDPALMDCKNNTYGIPRLLNCSYSYSYKIRSETRAHRVAFVTAAAEGGAGGDPAIVGAGSPLYTLLHEFAHSFGVADEYKYSASEAQIYCVPPRSNPNSVSFSPLPSYASDVEARTLHRGQIPWFSKIGESTLITSGQSLGTMPGMFPKDQAALYPGGNCTALIPTWVPYTGINLMNSNSGNFNPIQQQTIVEGMNQVLGYNLVLRKKGDQEAGTNPYSSNQILKSLPSDSPPAPPQSQGVRSAK